MSIGLFVAANGLLAMLWFDSLQGVSEAVAGLLCLILFVVWQAYMHEAAHFFVARLVGAQQIGLQASWKKGFQVTYSIADMPLRLAAISAAGPVSGLALGSLGLAVAGQWRPAHPVWATWLTMASLIGCLQVVFLLPFAADGSMLVGSLWELITRKKETYENQ